MSWKLILTSCTLTFAGQILVWFQCNSQYISEWWKNHPTISILTFSIPAAFCFYWGWTYMVEATDSLWAARLIGFAVSFLVFPIMTWYFVGESMFRPKVLICVFLALIMIGVQLFYPESK